MRWGCAENLYLSEQKTLSLPYAMPSLYLLLDQEEDLTERQRAGDRPLETKFIECCEGHPCLGGSEF